MICKETTELCPIEHGDDTNNPIIYTRPAGHPVCFTCAAIQEAMGGRCPCCNYSTWRISPMWLAGNVTPAQDVSATEDVTTAEDVSADEMDMDPVEDVRGLFPSPAPSQPSTPRRDANQTTRRSAPRRPTERPRIVRSTGCQYVYSHARKNGCTLPGDLQRGTDGKWYCPAHLEDGPQQAADMQRVRRAKDEAVQLKERARLFKEKRRRQMEIQESERRAAEARRMLEFQNQINNQQ